MFVVEWSSVVEFQVCPHTCAPRAYLTMWRSSGEEKANSMFLKGQLVFHFESFVFVQLHVRLPQKWVREIWLVRSMGRLAFPQHKSVDSRNVYHPRIPGSFSPSGFDSAFDSGGFGPEGSF